MQNWKLAELIIPIEWELAWDTSMVSSVVIVYGSALQTNS